MFYISMVAGGVWADSSKQLLKSRNTKPAVHLEVYRTIAYTDNLC